MFHFPDLTPLFYLAIFGLVCAAVMIVGGVGGIAWWIFNHVQFV